MRRVWQQEHGGPEVLLLEDVEIPEPGDGEVLVRVEAVGVTLPGLLHLADIALPARPGGEIAGRVVAVGKGADRFQVGRSVAGLAMVGAMAEYAVAPEMMLDAVPDGVKAPAAMAVVRSGLVALAALRTARFVEGETVLVTAAAGGVGHLAVQLARALGAGRIIGSVSDPAKAAFVLAQGADEVVLSNEMSWSVETDVVIETVGGDLLPRALDTLKPFGRLVTLSAAPAQIPSHTLLTGMRTVSGLSMGLINRLDPDLITALREELWTLLTAGRISPAIAAELPLSEAAQAYRLLAGRANLGKIALIP